MIRHPLRGDCTGQSWAPARLMQPGESCFDVDFRRFDEIVPMQDGNGLRMLNCRATGRVGANEWGGRGTPFDTETMRAGFRWTGGQISSTHASLGTRNLVSGGFQVGFDYRAWQFNHAYDMYASGNDIGHLIRNNPRGGGGTDTTYDLLKVNDCKVGLLALNESARGFSDLMGGGLLPMMNNDIHGAQFHKPTHSAIQMACYDEEAPNRIQLWGGKVAEYTVGNSGWDDSRTTDAYPLTVGAAVNPATGAKRPAKVIELRTATYGVQAGHMILHGVTCDDGKTSRVFWLGSKHARVDTHNGQGGGNASQMLCHSTDPAGLARIHFHGTCGYFGFAEGVGRRPDALLVTEARPDAYYFVQMLSPRGRRIVDRSVPSSLPVGFMRTTPAAVAETLQGTSRVTFPFTSTTEYAAASQAAWGHNSRLIRFRSMERCGTQGNLSRARINLAPSTNQNRLVAMIALRNPMSKPIRVQVEFVTGYTSMHFAGNRHDRPGYYTLQPGVIYDLIAFSGQCNQPRYFVVSPWANDPDTNIDIEVSEPELVQGSQALLDSIFYDGARAA